VGFDQREQRRAHDIVERLRFERHAAGNRVGDGERPEFGGHAGIAIAIAHVRGDAHSGSIADAHAGPRPISDRYAGSDSDADSHSID
jgi:hypothetical protein